MATPTGKPLPGALPFSEMEVQTISQHNHTHSCSISYKHENTIIFVLIGGPPSIILGGLLKVYRLGGSEKNCINESEKEQFLDGLDKTIFSIFIQNTNTNMPLYMALCQNNYCVWYICVRKIVTGHWGVREKTLFKVGSEENIFEGGAKEKYILFDFSWRHV